METLEFTIPELRVIHQLCLKADPMTLFDVVNSIKVKVEEAGKRIDENARAQAEEIARETKEELAKPKKSKKN